MGVAANQLDVGELRPLFPDTAGGPDGTGPPARVWTRR
jgi:hypothetical protein